MKKGYTLIELMVVLMMWAIVSLGIFTLISKGIDILKNRELERCNIQLMSFISYSQNYCKANGIRGNIYFEEEGKNLKIFLNSNSEEVSSKGDTISEIRFLSKNYGANYIFNINESYVANDKWYKSENCINISNLGMINNPGSIETQYGKKKKQITLGTGGVYGEK